MGLQKALKTERSLQRKLTENNLKIHVDCNKTKIYFLINEIIE